MALVTYGEMEQYAAEEVAEALNTSPDYDLALTLLREAVVAGERHARDKCVFPHTTMASLLLFINKVGRIREHPLCHPLCCATRCATAPCPVITAADVDASPLPRHTHVSTFTDVPHGWPCVGCAGCPHVLLLHVQGRRQH